MESYDAYALCYRCHERKSILNCRIRNLSEGGARLELPTAQLLPHTFELHITGMPVRQCALLPISS